MNDQTGRLSPIAEAVQIIQNVVVMGTSNPTEQIERLHALMRDWAYASAKANGDIPADMPLTAALLGDDPNAEGEPATATAYWRETSAFFRKVFQACAAAA